MKNYLKVWGLLLIGFFGLGACSDDNNTTSVTFTDQPAADIISSGTVDVITENTARYHVINFDGAPYTVTIVESENNLVIVDLGPEPTLGIELRNYVNAINKPGDVIITHNHGDHYGGAGSFTDYNFYSESVVAAQLQATEGFTSLYPNQVIPVANNQIIGELDFKFATVSEAETGENGYIYQEDLKILFAGDLVYNQTHPFIREYTPSDEPDELSNWIAGLELLKTQFSDYNYLFVGHNKYRTDISTALDENMAYLQKAQALILGRDQLTGGGYATTQQQIIDELDSLYPSYLPGGLNLSLADAFFPGDTGADWFINADLTEVIVEVTTFNLSSGVDATVFQARDAEIEAEFSRLQPGFLRRMSGVDANGKYVVLVFWETLQDADNSIAAFGQTASVSDYFAMIDGATFLAERYRSFEVPNINFSLMENNVIEITSFNIVDGTDPNTFISRDNEIELQYAALQPGFIRRTSGVEENDKYAVIVFWDTLADADASITEFNNEPSVSDYASMIDGSTFTAERFSLF